ncbi:MAG TPA: hypothetical protein GXX55_03855 [Firmicutes bacterium]|nr:hypothetical protein [Bacillota bacterium]
MWRRALRLAGYLLAYQAVRMLTRRWRETTGVRAPSVLARIRGSRSPARAGFLPQGWWGPVRQAIRWTGRLSRLLD